MSYLSSAGGRLRWLFDGRLQNRLAVERAAVPRRLAWMRRQFRASEAWFILLAVGIGAVAGAATVLQGWLAHLLQQLTYNIPEGIRLSGAENRLVLADLIFLPIGGAVVGLLTLFIRLRKRALVDAVEANALHGGRMSLPDSLLVSGQTLVSNGFGASVGLEAAYAQMGGGLASALGQFFALRRHDLRVLVGAGTGAAIAAAFGAPLTGAFYAFEIVIGAYSPAALAPVAAAALSGTLVAKAFGAAPYLIDVTSSQSVRTVDYLIYGGLGAACAGLGILLMVSVSRVEQFAKRLHIPLWARPVIGGVFLMPLAWISPQVLSSGHGALHLNLGAEIPMVALFTLLVLKSLASAISLGFGFRGGLFFASLLLGSLVGHLFAGAILWVMPDAPINPADAALVAMAAFSVAVVGGPITMSMLVLEATHDVSLTGIVIAATLVSSAIARETFGYSFSTWRLHLRGETIKSARDVGWIRTLTAGRLMRRDVKATPASTTIAAFRKLFPLGATSRVVLVHADGKFAGIVAPSLAYGSSLDPEAPIETLADMTDTTTTTTAACNVVELMQIFDREQKDELAVLAADGTVLGVVTEAFVRRRYAEELEKGQKELFGER